MSVLRSAKKAAAAIGQMETALKGAVKQSGTLASNVAAATAGGGGPLGDAPLGQSPGTQRSRTFNIDARKTRLERLPEQTFQRRFPGNTVAGRSEQVRGVAVVSRTVDSIVVQAGIFGPTLTSDVYGAGESFEGFVVVLTQGGPSSPQRAGGFIFDGFFYATDIGGDARATGGGDGASGGRGGGGGSSGGGGKGRSGSVLSRPPTAFPTSGPTTLPPAGGAGGGGLSPGEVAIVSAIREQTKATEALRRELRAPSDPLGVRSRLVR